MGRRKRKIESNTKLIDKAFDSFDEDKLNGYIIEKLSDYLNNAIRLALYYGNLRIRDVGFNFTLIAFFVSILALYIPITVN